MATSIWNDAVYGVNYETNTQGIAADAVVGIIISIKFPDGRYYKGIITEMLQGLPTNLVKIMFKDEDDGMFDTLVNVNLNKEDFKLGGTIDRAALETFVMKHSKQPGTLFRRCPHCNLDLNMEFGKKESLMDKHEAGCKSNPINSNNGWMSKRSKNSSSVSSTELQGEEEVGEDDDNTCDYDINSSPLGLHHTLLEKERSEAHRISWAERRTSNANKGNDEEEEEVVEDEEGEQHKRKRSITEVDISRERSNSEEESNNDEGAVDDEEDEGGQKTQAPKKRKKSREGDEKDNITSSNMRRDDVLSPKIHIPSMGRAPPMSSTCSEKTKEDDDESKIAITQFKINKFAQGIAQDIAQDFPQWFENNNDTDEAIVKAFDDKLVLQPLHDRITKITAEIATIEKYISLLVDMIATTTFNPTNSKSDINSAEQHAEQLKKNLNDVEVRLQEARNGTESRMELYKRHVQAELIVTTSNESFALGGDKGTTDEEVDDESTKAVLNALTTKCKQFSIEATAELFQTAQWNDQLNAALDDTYKEKVAAEIKPHCDEVNKAEKDLDAVDELIANQEGIAEKFHQVGGNTYSSYLNTMGEMKTARGKALEKVRSKEAELKSAEDGVETSMNDFYTKLKNAATIRIGRSIASPTLDEDDIQWKRKKHDATKTSDESKVSGEQN